MYPCDFNGIVFVAGYPAPNVTWYRDGKLWDNTFKKGASSVVNEMKLRNLSRSELMATFQCKAQNTKLISPIVRKIVIDLYRKYYSFHYMKNA